jgi:hypothetical protein
MPGPYLTSSFGDPGAALGALTAASETESGPATPFMGLATKVSADPLFGTASTSIPIELPLGRKLTPDLTVRYSSNGGNGILGLGWELPLGSIKRRTSNGLPMIADGSSYDDTKGFVLSAHGTSIELDTCIGGGTPCTQWAASVEEQWVDARFEQSVNRWVVTEKNGTSYIYGGTAEARSGVSINSASQTFAWFLTQIVDLNDNRIDVTYLGRATGEPPSYAYVQRVLQSDLNDRESRGVGSGRDRGK